MRIVKWELKVRKEPNLGVGRRDRNRSGPEVEDWRARMKGNVRAGMETGTREGWSVR